MSMLFSMSISFFTLIAGSIGGIDQYLGCQTKFKRIFKIWNYIDRYMFEVDKRFCSNLFACELTPYTIQLFKKDPIVGTLFQDLYKEGTDYTFIKLEDLNNKDSEDRKVKWEDVQTNGNAQTDLPDLMKDIDNFKYKKFNQFWRYIEDKFDCSGFCSTVYQAEESSHRKWNTTSSLKTAPRQVPIFKYLFSDVNKGIPKHRGCMKRILQWLPRMLITFGSFALAASLLQFILFFLSLQLMGQFGIPSNPKSNSQVANLNEHMNKDENKNLKEEDRK